MNPRARPKTPWRQNELLALYRQRAEAGDAMPTLREAGALLGISHERVRQLSVKLSARQAIEVEAYAPRGVRVRHEGDQGPTPT